MRTALRFFFLFCFTLAGGISIEVFSADAQNRAQQTSPASEPTHSHASPSGTPDDEWTALQDAMTRMHNSMSAVERTGDPDSDFVRLMLPHHQAALDMARAQLLHGKDPEIRRLAQEIITDQQSEIELMQLWLKKHKP